MYAASLTLLDQEILCWVPCCDKPPPPSWLTVTVNANTDAAVLHTASEPRSHGCSRVRAGWRHTAARKPPVGVGACRTQPGHTIPDIIIIMLAK